MCARVCGCWYEKGSSHKRKHGVMLSLETVTFLRDFDDQSHHCHQRMTKNSVLCVVMD